MKFLHHFQLISPFFGFISNGNNLNSQAIHFFQSFMHHLSSFFTFIDEKIFTKNLMWSAQNRVAVHTHSRTSTYTNTSLHPHTKYERIVNVCVQKLKMMARSLLLFFTLFRCVLLYLLCALFPTQFAYEW